MKILRSPIHLATILLCLLFYPLAQGAENQEVLRTTLDNGLRVVIVKNTLAPVITTQVNYLVGAPSSASCCLIIYALKIFDRRPIVNRAADKNDPPNRYFSGGFS